jgi:hypothetical protein
MALTDSNGGGLSAADLAAVIGNNGNGWGLGGDAWVILFLFAMMGGGFGNGFGWGGNGMLGVDFPWLMSGQNGINMNTNAGFNQAETQRAIGDLNSNVISGFGDVQTSLCGGFAGVNATVNNAQNAIAQQIYTNQIADLERSFNSQTATTGGLQNISTQLAQCCCDNRAATQDVKYTIATEACATRQASTANTQAILDKLCQLELDGVKAQVEAKNDRIAELQAQLTQANFAASQTAQNAFISQGFANEVDALYNRLQNCPVPSEPVYGRQPIFTCPQTAMSGCGCM